MPASSAADTSTEHIARDIAAAIVAHRLPPGTRLREEALARAYGVSRTKIRAALLILSKDKLDPHRTGQGRFRQQAQRGRGARDFSVRRILETAMAREFVARARPVDYKRIEQHLKQERKAVAGSDVQLRNRLLGDFHILLAEVAGNSVLTEMLRELSARSAVITVLYQSTMDAACSSDEHHAFLDAARKGDVELACRLMIQHLDHVESGLDFEADTDGDGDLVAALLT